MANCSKLGFKNVFYRVSLFSDIFFISHGTKKDERKRVNNIFLFLLVGSEILFYLHKITIMNKSK